MNDDHIPLANSKVGYSKVLEETGYAVSRTTVRAGGATDWHHHTEISDRFIVVSGVLTVELKSNGVVSKLAVSDDYAVPPGVSHHVMNETEEDVVYIMVQSGGQRDIVLEPAQAA